MAGVECVYLIEIICDCDCLIGTIFWFESQCIYLNNEKNRKVFISVKQLKIISIY